jgi:uracil-DNA glycosylase
MNSLAPLLTKVRACTLCAKHLPHGPRPVLQLAASARILIAGQAPGRKVHESGIPFEDASGERLRQWLGMRREVFYDADQIAILPMGFCFPGTAKSGDLPPRPECAPAWRTELLAHLTQLQLTLVIGQYAQNYHLPLFTSLTDAVQASQVNFASYTEHTVIALPHPSPRNNLWLKRNPWFEQDLVPKLQNRVVQVLA